MKEGRVDKKFRKVDADIIIREGRVFFMEEDMTQEHPIEEIFDVFGGDFCKISISNEVKSDNIE